MPTFFIRIFRNRTGIDHIHVGQVVKNLLSNNVEISSHNHGFAVTADSDLQGGEVTHINLNDGTVEGLKHRTLPIFAVQYHPEAAPGPPDAVPMFDQFVTALKLRRVSGEPTA